MKHTQQRVYEIYGIIINDNDYYELCTLINRGIDCTLVNIDRQASSIKEIYRVLFKGTVIFAVWDSLNKIVKTVINNTY